MSESTGRFYAICFWALFLSIIVHAVAAALK